MTSLSVHLFNIFLCVVLVIVTKRSEDLYASFILVSLLRVLNISMPRFFELSLYLFIFIYLPIIIAAFIFWYVLKVPEGRKIDGPLLWRFVNGVGPDDAPTFRWAYVPLALGIGLVLAFLEYWVLSPEALVPSMGLGDLMLLMTVMVVFVGLGEELVFRAALQESVRERSTHHLRHSVLIVHVRHHAQRLRVGPLPLLCVLRRAGARYSLLEDEEPAVRGAHPRLHQLLPILLPAQRLVALVSYIEYEHAQTNFNTQ